MDNSALLSTYAGFGTFYINFGIEKYGILQGRRKTAVKTQWITLEMLISRKRGGLLSGDETCGYLHHP